MKRFLTELKFEGMAPQSIMFYKDVGHSQEGSQEVTKLLEAGVFDGPKPVRLLRRLLTLANLEKDSIVLDYLSGSATTAHALMQMNAEDGGQRKFILVQLPESTEDKSEAAKAGYKNICEIGKERIRRAGAKIKADSPLITGGLDVGFRVLKLDSSNMKDVYYTPDEFLSMAQKQMSIEGFTDNIKEDRSDEDLLFQVMLDLGIPLSAKITGDGDVYRVNDSYLIACFKRADTALITEIAKQKPYYAVFRDSSFASDSAMVNFEQVFATYSPNTIRRVL
jgi:adenine-specific DNA-methyltransferase